MPGIGGRAGALPLRESLVERDFFAVNIESVLVNKLSKPFMTFTPCAFSSPAMPFAQACNNRILVFGKLCKIKPDLTGCYTAGRSIQRRLINFRTVQQCFLWECSRGSNMFRPDRAPQQAPCFCRIVRSV